jgi:hypothetical protein
VTFSGLTLALPNGWIDTTDDLPEGAPPTLAKSDGLGALQFSRASYRGGEHPGFQHHDLLAMLDEFGRSRHLGPATSITSARSNVLRVSGDFASVSEFIRAWYLTDGTSIALVTYVVLGLQEERWSDELREVESIVESVRF